MSRFKKFLFLLYKPMGAALLFVFLLLLPVQIGEKDANRDLWFVGDLERVSEEYYTTTLAQMAAAWAIVKISSKTVAMLQRGEISFTPLGVGVSLAPGELLAVVSDNLERIANVLFVLVLVLLLQQFSLGFLSFVCLKILFPIALLFYIAGFFGFRFATILAAKLCKIALILWLCFPASAVISNFLQQGYLDEKRTQNLHILQTQETGLQNLQKFQDFSEGEEAQNMPHNEENLGFLSSLWQNAKEIASNTSNHFQKTKERAIAQIDSIVESLDGLVDRLLELTAIFVLTTLVLPFSVLMFLFWVSRG